MRTCFHSAAQGELRNSTEIKMKKLKAYATRLLAKRKRAKLPIIRRQLSPVALSSLSSDRAQTILFKQSAFSDC